MINNRQNGRRGRGRNGVRPQGGGGGTGRPEQGNRIDNRARGNAAQLLEKYKALARDAQMASDRVMTEYYLQFADHYFRVLADSRARFEEQRRPQGEQQGGANSFQDEYDGDDGEADITDSFDDPRPDQQQPRYQDRGSRNDGGQNGGYQGQRNDRTDGNRQDRAPRQDRDRDRPQGEGQQNGYQQNGYAQDRGPRQDRADRQDRPERQGSERQDRQDRPFRARDGQNDGRPDRQPRQQGGDGQERGQEGPTYRTISAESDRGPVPSPLAQAPVTRTDPQDQDAAREPAPRRTRTRRPVAETQPAEPVAETPVAPPAPAEEAPRRERRPRVARTAAPAAGDGNDQIDRLALPPAFLSKPAADPAPNDAPAAEEKPRRRRRTRAEMEADDSGDVAA